MSEQIYVDRTTTWHAIGKDVSECKDMEKVLEKSGLDYEVEKKSIFFRDDHIVNPREEMVPNRFVTVRTEDNHVYDVVSDKYEVIQNRDAFDFVNYMGEDLSFEKAGETKSGMVYIIGKLPEVSILDDSFVPHVIFRNGFNGRTKITAAITPLRLVCQNQFNLAFEDAENTITVRHLSNAEAKLEDAKDVLKMSAEYMEKLNETAERLAGMKMSKSKQEKVIDMLFPEPTEDMDPYKRVKMENARNLFLRAHNEDDNANFAGTAWGLVNAYTDMMTHKKPEGKREDRFEGKFISTTFRVPMNPVIDAIESVA